MKYFTQIILIFFIVACAVQVNAQSNMDDDKIYKEPQGSSATTNNFYLKFMLEDYQNQVQLDPNYPLKIKQKWEARNGVSEIVIDEVNMIIKAEIDKTISDHDVMDLLKMLNPNVTQIISRGN